MDRTEVNRRTSPAAHIGTAEMSLAMWLRNGRAQRNLSLDDVARITKIQPRILERLEAGRLDGLPAEVFVRGFVRSFAKCVGLDEDEAIRRYGACAAPQAKAGASAARAMVEAMGDLAPNTRSQSMSPKLKDNIVSGLAAGSMEISPTDVGGGIDNEPSVIIELIESADLADESVEIEVEPIAAVMPVVIEARGSGSTAVETIPVEPIPVELADALPTADLPTEEPVNADADAAVVTPPADVDAVVVAPPADVDLSAEIAIPAPKAKAKTPRGRKAVDPNAPKTPRRRSKVANGTPSEPTPVVAATPAPKRRRKAKGSIVPPLAEAQPGLSSDLATSDASVALTAIPADASLDGSLTPIPADAAIPAAALLDNASGAVTQIPDVATQIAGESRAPVVVDAGSAADEMFAPISSAQREAEHADPATVEVEPFATAIEFASISIPSQESFDSVDAFGDHETTRFEREDADVVATPSWTPRMPPFAAPTSTSWRRSAAAPSLVAVIDDADPEGAERALEDRRQRVSRRTFLPPILLDREGDRSARQGGLTLAVIILLIAATLTLSYLMRRPSSAGDGVTRADVSDTFVG